MKHDLTKCIRNSIIKTETYSFMTSVSILLRGVDMFLKRLDMYFYFTFKKEVWGKKKK